MRVGSAAGPAELTDLNLRALCPMVKLPPRFGQSMLIESNWLRNGGLTHLLGRRRPAPARPPLLLPAGAFSAFLFPAVDARAQARAGSCDDPEIAMLRSPLSPWKGAPLRVIFTAEKPVVGELTLVAP